MTCCCSRVALGCPAAHILEKWPVTVHQARWNGNAEYESIYWHMLDYVIMHAITLRCHMECRCDNGCLCQCSWTGRLSCMHSRIASLTHASLVWFCTNVYPDMCTGALMPSDRPIQNRVILFMHGSCAVRIPSLMTHVHFMHACMLTCSVWLYSSSHCAFLAWPFLSRLLSWRQHGQTMVSWKPWGPSIASVLLEVPSCHGVACMQYHTNMFLW